MKKVLTEKVLEEAQYFCDKHPDRECFSELKTASWYGSIFDLTGIEIHLCDECLKEFYDHCLTTYKVKPKDIDI
jgi:hypothetical protein